MQITSEVLAGVPAENVRVPVEDFGAVWRRAESECVRLVLSSSRDMRAADYASGVMGACRWLAAADVPLGGGGGMEPLWTPASAPIPVDGQWPAATPATIEAVRREGWSLMERFPGGYVRRPGAEARPGFLEGIVDALVWAYGQGPQPKLGATDHHHA
ncbi:hypothetical protein OG394_15090 [Kribbella sp. NBC_01245]|uniref:hypothetical protein n=1 Tax=Kribbella sp. NBC_01245 TaxID=2903578 RepID=UPI002E2CC058|nr:hypothetical protein [Kribbella sp. NBC_01245]